MVFNQELIEFFIKHNLYDKDMFDYFSKNATMIDYRDEEQRIYIGCFYALNHGKRLQSIHINVPYVYDDITMLISIHELVHALVLYKYLNKKVKIGIDVEVLPMFYEKIYIDENNNPKLIAYEEQLNRLINKKTDREYKLGLELRDRLLADYDYDIKKVQRKLKQLVKSSYYN